LDGAHGRVVAHEPDAHTSAASGLAFRCHIAAFVAPQSRKKEEDVRDSRVARWPFSSCDVYMLCAETSD
jgi:hypothetical protein